LPKAKAQEDGQLDFATKDIADDKVEQEIAKNLRIRVDTHEAHKKYAAAMARLKQLLPLDEIEEPTRFKIAGGEFGNFVVEVRLRDRDERGAVPAGVTKSIRIIAS
jgi:hypothetical protein